MKRLLFVLAGCARAGAGDVDSGVRQDTQIRVDAPAQIDAPGPQTRTLVETTSQTLKAAASIACPSQTGTGTAANNYYRVFDPAAFGITTDFKVTQVAFQVEACHSYIGGTSGTTVAVRVGTYNGTPGNTLAAANMTVLASNPTVTVPEVIESGSPPTTPGATVTAPISATIPAGTKLFVEVDSPDGTNRYYFYMGANDGGETAPGYVLGPACNITTPTNVSTVSGSFPNVDLLLTVTGSY